MQMRTEYIINDNDDINCLIDLVLHDTSYNPTIPQYFW